MTISVDSSLLTSQSYKELTEQYAQVDEDADLVNDVFRRFAGGDLGQLGDDEFGLDEDYSLALEMTINDSKTVSVVLELIQNRLLGYHEDDDEILEILEPFIWNADLFYVDKVLWSAVVQSFTYIEYVATTC